MRVLMLGNSLSTANGLPDLLAGRLQAEVVVHARGGARLAEHLNPRTKLGSKTARALGENHFDYVVLQEMSSGPLRFQQRFLDSAVALADISRGAGAVPVLYATWAYAPGCPKLDKLGITSDEMHAAMHDAALEAARESGALLADACLAFHEHPDKQALYAPDGVHPSPAGTQVALDSIAAAIDASGAPAAASEPAYTVYLLRCEDGSYYTGITTDIERRVRDHLSRGSKAARYTRTHPVAALAATWEAVDRAQASRLEYRIKRLTHGQKEQLAANPALLDSFLPPM